MAFRYPSLALRCLAGRRRSSLLAFVVVRRRSWGSSRPSQFSSHIRVDTPCLLHMTSARAHRCALRGAAFLPVRAHVPFMPPASAPIDFRRGDRSPVGNHCDLQKRSAGDGDGFDFWASTPVCGPPPRRTFGRRSASCLGLFLLQGYRAPFAVHRPGSSPVTDHPPPEHRRATLIDAGCFLSAHGLGDDPSHHARLSDAGSCSDALAESVA